MYDRHFEGDWESLDQERAMFRAFALGVDAAFGNDHPTEYERLQRAHHRALIQIAFEEGESRAKEAIAERGLSPTDRAEFEPGDPEWAVWEELVADRETDSDAFEAVQVPRSQLDLPEALDRPSFLDRPSQRTDAITLPRFLRR
ncbi:hypothetical protein RH831_01840 [Halodesulfurarchaeum sp. HSR-GB]|uniref:hypothetical protein n=1 Tax=Halodesulfurarchaeum sp. HSR-GB TaxID=3074077 RepID=UPI0028617C68|nr:hypothetical protein [Halodesulfurarchaeum sp. HSR-GB]MDR5655925.1 hypothetical protein [Halodesulfurarchaeum sp. HSR-GB]